MLTQQVVSSLLSRRTFQFDRELLIGCRRAGHRALTWVHLPGGDHNYNLSLLSSRASLLEKLPKKRDLAEDRDFAKLSSHRGAACPDYSGVPALERYYGFEFPRPDLRVVLRVHPTIELITGFTVAVIVPSSLTVRVIKLNAGIDEVQLGDGNSVLNLLYHHGDSVAYQYLAGLAADREGVLSAD